MLHRLLLLLRQWVKFNSRFYINLYRLSFYIFRHYTSYSSTPVVHSCRIRWRNINSTTTYRSTSRPNKSYNSGWCAYNAKRWSAFSNTKHSTSNSRTRRPHRNTTSLNLCPRSLRYLNPFPRLSRPYLLI